MILDRVFPLPDFLGIGAMRAGTSWLARGLAAHPRIALRRKEIHFFDRKLERRLIPGIARSREARVRYRTRFAGSGLGGRITGEFTPAYAILDRERIITVRDWMPEAKLLFIMRDPVERAWSQAKHDYARFLGRDAAAATETELREFFERPRVRARGDYATCLENWLGFYPRERFFLTFLEHVRADPARVLSDAFSFLGVPVDAELKGVVGPPVHAGPVGAIPAWAREHLERTFRPRDGRLEAIVGQPLPWRDGPGR